MPPRSLKKSSADLNTDMWDILGIELTTDIRTIKSAYAKQAKLYNPEEYPEEFKQIHNAYKNAIAYARNKNAYENDRSEENAGDSSISADKALETTTSAAVPEFSFDGIEEQTDISCESMTREEIMSAVLKKIRLTANSEKNRSDPQVWKSIVESEAFESLIMDHEFRKRAGDILFGVIFTYEAARIIADGFGYGSYTEITSYYPEKLCSVSITEHILHYKPQNIAISEYKSMKRIDTKLLIFVCIAVFAAAFVFGTLIYYAPD